MDAHRAALGMPPLADYLALVCDEGGPCHEVPESIEAPGAEAVDSTVTAQAP